MDALIGGLVLVLLVLGFGPSVRGVQYGIEAIENPGKPDTQAEHDRANSDLVRLLVLVTAVFGLMFVWEMGAI